MRKLWAASAAMLLCLALGLPALAQDASPAGAQDEVLYEITVPETAIPDALGKIVVDELTVAPGTDVSIPWDNEAILGRGMFVESGQLAVTPAYDALLWTGAAAKGGTPVSVPAGEPVSLAVGDVLLLPAIARDDLDPAAEVGIANPGTDPAVVFAFHMHWWEMRPRWPKGVRATQGITFGWPDELSRVQGGDTVFRLTRLAVPPGEALPFPDDAAFVFEYLKSGTLSDWTILGSGPKERAVDEARPQHIVTGDVPAEVLELAVIPSASATSPTSVPTESAAASPPAPNEPVAVTGTEACTITRMGVMTYSDGVERFRDHLLDCLDTMSDPRVSGHYTNHFNYDCYGGDDCIFWGTHVLDGPDGGWDCSYTGTTNPTTAYEYLVLLICPGTGVYEGLTYTTYHVFNMNDESANFGNGMSFGGLIYKDPPPPWGPLPTAASE